MQQSSFKQQFTGLFLLAAVLFGNLSTFAQRRAAAPKTSAPSGQTTTAASNQKKEDKKDCKAGYSGFVTHNRTVKQNDTSSNGSFHNSSYVYQSTIPIRDDGSTQGSIYPSVAGIQGSFNFYGKATATLVETLDKLQISEGSDYCKASLKGFSDKRIVRCESRSTRDLKADGTDNVSVFLSFKGDKYKISLDNPKVSRQVTETSKKSCTGTCTPDKPINSSRTDIVADSAQFETYTDEIQFNPESFNRLSGTSTRTNGNETITITWNLSRCAPPLQLADLTFEDHQYPDPTNWTSTDPIVGTTDGNLVKITARVFNSGGETSYTTVKFTDTTTGEMLPDGSISVQVKPGETRDVEYEWDTSGYAWDENQKPKSEREIKAGVDGDSKTEKINIIPKPVVTVHGLWSNASAWADYHTYLQNAHSLKWRVFPVGEDPEHGKMNTGNNPGNAGQTNTIYQNARELEK